MVLGNEYANLWKSLSLVLEYVRDNEAMLRKNT